MRDIKFRAFIKSLKWMLFVENINFSVETVEVDLSSGWGDYSEYDFDEVEIMQYTGLKDKNGKEIYDGDIAKIRKARGVTIDYGFFEITGQVFCHNGSYYIGGQDVLLSSMKPLDIEVIGNIFENPELLEVAK